MIIVNSRKYDGSIRRSWKCELLERSDSLLMFVGEFDSDLDHPDLGCIKKGTISYEYYWLDRWYNIFRFHEPSGELKYFYCNINMPPKFADDVLDYVDLDIDVLVRPDFSHVVLDRHDYERNAELFGYPIEVKAQVEKALKEVLELVSARDLPRVPELFVTSSAELRESG